MHGIIHSELRRFVIENFNENAWNTILKESGLKEKIFLISQAYPDEMVVAIVNSASRVSGLGMNVLLEKFGEFITPLLLSLYHALIRPDWKSKDFFLNAEETIHRVVRMRNPGALPPRLHFEDTGKNTLRFVYSSHRNMSDVAVGIMKGVAKHYNERIQISGTKSNNGVIMNIIIS